MTAELTHRLDADELAAYERDGYVVRRGVFDADEVADMAAHCEALVDDLVRDRVGFRMNVGSYVFDPDLLRGVMIKWEGDSDVVHGIEPFAHLSDPLEAWGRDARLVDPMRSVLGHDDVMLYTEKLNLKRPRHGGPNPWHQDYPYWVDASENAHEIATTIVYLDDATVDNGCTWVVPGSHLTGVWKTRQDTDTMGQNEIDPSAYPPGRDAVPVEVEAGSTVTFGSLLVHQSTPNTSDEPRRALLYSYQPAGRERVIDQLRRMAENVS
jgi:ectoine hydroxylase-related dioxygenase (phytanoyl-CoA dioxygenase family)